MDCVKQRHNREVLKERLRSENHFIRVFFFTFIPCCRGYRIILVHESWTLDGCFQNKFESLHIVVSEEESLSAIHEMFRLLLKLNIITLFKRPRAASVCRLQSAYKQLEYTLLPPSGHAVNAFNLFSCILSWYEN